MQLNTARTESGETVITSEHHMGAAWTQQKRPGLMEGLLVCTDDINWTKVYIFLMDQVGKTMIIL